jgi:hypothetical protein
VERKICFDNAQVQTPADAPPITRWIAKEIERWVMHVENQKVKAQIADSTDLLDAKTIINRGGGGNLR